MNLKNIILKFYHKNRCIKFLRIAENMAKQAIARFEKIDVLVNNAGITKDSLLLRMTPEDFDKVINTI